LHLWRVYVACSWWLAELQPKLFKAPVDRAALWTLRITGFYRSFELQVVAAIRGFGFAREIPLNH
jgi:hypothetical protein